MDDYVFYNAMNSSFYAAPIDLDVDDFMLDKIEQPLTGRANRVLSVFERDRTERPADLDVVRRARPRPCPRYDRLAFPTSSGYTHYKDYSTGLFFGKLFSLTKAAGLHEPKLLINHAFEQPLYSRVYTDNTYKAEIFIPDRYARMWHSFISVLSNKIELSDIKIYAHKDTTPGPPFSFSNGFFYAPEDFRYGDEYDFLQNVVIALRKDYSLIKRDWFNKFDYIHSAQVHYSGVGIDNLHEDDVIRLYKNCVLPTAVPGYRKNSIDAADIDVETDFNIKRRYYTKNRQFGLFRGGFVHGTIDNKKLTDYVNSRANMKYFFATNRSREITNVSWPSQASAFVSTKMIMTWLEHSRSGFASVQPEVVSSYNSFIKRVKERAFDIIFLNGDRSNAETFVTTNYDEYQKLVLPDLRKLYLWQNSIVMFAEQYYYTHGLPSGIARTTELNWYAGTHEALTVIADIFNCQVEYILDVYTTSVLNSDDFFVVGDFMIKLFMPTDDIPLIIAGNVDAIEDEIKKAIRKSEKRRMSWIMNREMITTFGVDITRDGMSAAKVSVISKLFYSESPGFFVKDCFSLVSKLDMLPYELRRDIIRLYEQSFSTRIGGIRKAAEGFKKWLSDFGIPIDSVISMYSPSSQVMYGSFVSENSITESARVPSDHIKAIFNFYKGVFNAVTKAC